MQATGDPWQMMKYEVKMFIAAYKIFFTRLTFTRLPYALKNAIEESAVLHTRNLCEVFLGLATREDDIQLTDLFTGWPDDARYATITAKIDKLRTRYLGNGKNDPNAPRWNFDKRVMHPTSHRAKEYNYENILDDLYPLIQDIIAEVKFLTGKRFRLQFDGPTSPRKVFWP